MHEASLAGSILQLVEDSAQRECFQRVTLLRLAVGRLANVDLGALRFALLAIAKGNVLEGAVLEFEEPEGQAWCSDCSQTVGLTERGMACGLCGDYQLRITGGTELRVIDMLVSDE